MSVDLKPNAPETNPKPRWFRFSLRALLVLVTRAAVASWGYWIGWPWWENYRLHQEFERSAKEIKINMTVGDAIDQMGHKVGEVSHEHYRQLNGKEIFFSRYRWPDSEYCIYYVIGKTSGNSPYQGTISSVEVFRLPPRSYQGNDFLEFISGDRKSNSGLQYELIYSDPPRGETP